MGINSPEGRLDGLRGPRKPRVSAVLSGVSGVAREAVKKMIEAIPTPKPSSRPHRLAALMALGLSGCVLDGEPDPFDGLGPARACDQASFQPISAPGCGPCTDSVGYIGCTESHGPGNGTYETCICAVAPLSDGGFIPPNDMGLSDRDILDAEGRDYAVVPDAGVDAALTMDSSPDESVPDSSLDAAPAVDAGRDFEADSTPDTAVDMSVVDATPDAVVDAAPDSQPDLAVDMELPVPDMGQPPVPINSSLIVTHDNDLYPGSSSRLVLVTGTNIDGTFTLQGNPGYIDLSFGRGGDFLFDFALDNPDGLSAIAGIPRAVIQAEVPEDQAVLLYRAADLNGEELPSGAEVDFPDCELGRVNALPFELLPIIEAGLDNPWVAPFQVWVGPSDPDQGDAVFSDDNGCYIAVSATL